MLPELADHEWYKFAGAEADLDVWVPNDATMGISATTVRHWVAKAQGRAA